jgi:hypothetical protein
MKISPRLFYLRGPSQSTPLWIEEDKRVFYTIINEAEDDDGCFKFPQFTIPHLKKISHGIETNLMSWQHLVFSTYLSHRFYGKTQQTQKSMLLSTYWPYYSDMECKENYRRVMTTCVRKVYDNDKEYYTPWPDALKRHRLQPTKHIGKSGTACDMIKWNCGVCFDDTCIIYWHATCY